MIKTYVIRCELGVYLGLGEDGRALFSRMKPAAEGLLFTNLNFARERVKWARDTIGWTELLEVTL